MRPPLLRGLTAVAAVAAGTPAGAQLLQDPPTVVIPAEPPLTTARSIFDRAADVPVNERMLPAFSAQGVSLGDFELFPAAVVGGYYTDNVYADDDRREDDLALVIRPEATIRTSAGPYRVAAYARGDVRRYVDNASENTEEGLVGLNGSVAVGALSNLSAGVSYGSLIVPRFAPDSPVCAGKPLEYSDLSTFAGARIEGASTRVTLRADASRLRFDDTPDRCVGGELLTRDRDRTRIAGLLRVERALSPAVSVYVAGTLNTFDYRFQTAGGLDRDSWGFGAFVGVNAEVSRLLRADVRAGYIKQDFDTPGVDPIAGFGAQAEAFFFPSRLTTVTVRAESSVQDTGVPGTTGFLRRGGSVGVDHELRRYLIASLTGSYFHDTYRGSPRRDDIYYTEVSATYLSRNHWNARLAYRLRARESDAALTVASFDESRLMATLTLQY